MPPAFVAGDARLAFPGCRCILRCLGCSARLAGSWLRWRLGTRQTVLERLRCRVHRGLPVVSFHHAEGPFLEVDRRAFGGLQERILVLCEG